MGLALPGDAGAGLEAGFDLAVGEWDGAVAAPGDGQVELLGLGGD